MLTHTTLNTEHLRPIQYPTAQTPSRKIVGRWEDGQVTIVENGDTYNRLIQSHRKVKVGIHGLPMFLSRYIEIREQTL